MRVRRAVHERLARPHAVTLVHRDVLAARDQILLRLAVVGPDHDLAHAFDETRELHHPVDLGDGRVLARLARLEQLGHARETARDVLGLRRLTRDLGEDVALEHLGAIGHQQVSAHRQHVAAARFPDASSALGASPTGAFTETRG